MAENKKSFVAYCDWGEIFDSLEDKQAGKLAKHMFDYVRDLSPNSDKLTELLFITIKQSLKRDLIKYEVYKEKQKANGKKGGRPKEIDSLKSYTGKLIPKKSNNHFIYIIEDVVNNEIKIGETSNLIQRRYDIKRPTNNLEIVDFHLLDAFNCQRIEREILNEYKEYSIGGDWFKLDQETLNRLVSELSQKTQRFSKIPKKADNVNVNDNDINTIVLNTQTIDQWILDLKNETQFLEGLYMTHKLRNKTLGSIALLFKEHLKMHPKNHEKFNDFKNHFGTWVGYKIKKGELGEYLKHQKGEL